MRKIVLSLALTLSVSSCDVFLFTPKPEITVISIEALDSDQKETFLEAVKGWNKKLGFEHFIVDPYRLKINFWVQTNQKLLDSEKTLGFLTHRGIYIKRGIPKELLLKVSYHELGHAMGMPHTDNISSIMYPYAIDSMVSQPTGIDVIWAKSLIGYKEFDRDFRFME